MSTVVLLVLSIAAAYLLTRFVVGRLQRRFVFVTGLEFVLLGALLGPAFPQIGVFEDLTPITPIIALGAGWVGLLSGMRIDLFRRSPGSEGSFSLALVLVLGTGAAIAAAAFWFFTSGHAGDIPFDEAALSAGVLGCAAAAGSSTAVDLLEERYRLDRGLVVFLRRTSELLDALAISIFGVLFCFFHRGQSDTVRPLAPIEWIGITLGLSVLLGLVFAVFLVEDESEHSRFLALVGIIAFASGAAFFLHLSPLLVNLLLGMVLVSTEKSGQAILATLQGTSRPMRLMLLVFAGALFQPPPLLPTLAALLAYIVLRTTGRLFSPWLASFALSSRADIGRGLLAQGDVALAMALSFRLVYQGSAVDIAYTVVLGSVLFHELVAPRVLRGLLIDAGEVRREVASRSTA